MRCKHDRAPAHAMFCPDCGARLIETRGEVKVPPPQILPSGTYFGRITVQGDRRSISAETEEEYYAKARAAKLGLIETKKAAPKMTLETAISKFIKDNDKVLSPSTIKAYKSMSKTRFVAYQERDISSINYQRMINDEATKVSAKTLSNAYRLVSASLHHAGAEVPVVKLPKIPKASRPWLDYEQIETFLAAIKDKPVETAALLALNGLRRSELFHLTSDDVDLQNHIIHVRGASVYNSNGQFVTKETNKNASSTRDVHIVIPRLETLLEGISGALVTVKPNTPYIGINRICKAVGLPQVGVHGLRHSFASLAYHLGWSEATTMREGGWSNSKTVHDIYTHLATQDVNADIERMRQFYTAEKPKNAPSHSESVAMKNPTEQKSE